jgi:hypothetical protein
MRTALFLTAGLLLGALGEYAYLAQEIKGILHSPTYGIRGNVVQANELMSMREVGIK